MPGATMSTHLGNGSHPLLPRHETTSAQMADDRLTAGMIADGHHLPRHSSADCRAKEPRRRVLVATVGLRGLPVEDTRRSNESRDSLTALVAGKRNCSQRFAAACGASQRD